MPFGGFKDFNDCIDTIMSKQGKSREEASAICGAIKAKTEDTHSLKHFSDFKTQEECVANIMSVHNKSKVEAEMICEVLKVRAEHQVKIDMKELSALSDIDVLSLQSDYPCDVNVNITPSEMLTVHNRMHIHWGLSRDESLWDCHKLLTEEMARRNIPHTIQDTLDKDMMIVGELPDDEETLNNLSVNFVQQYHNIIHHLSKNYQFDSGILNVKHEKIVVLLRKNSLPHFTPLITPDYLNVNNSIVVTLREGLIIEEQPNIKKEQEFINKRIMLTDLMIEKIRTKPEHQTHQKDPLDFSNKK